MNAGEQIGPYVIEAPIGEGGMGAVYRARDTRLDRTVALKVSKADFSDRFERDGTVQPRIPSPINRAHPALANEGFDDVWPDQIGRASCGERV